MKIINKKDKQITFTAEIDESLANSVRRYLNQIQVIAIDEIEISKNDSPLYDETIAHRIGLIPLKMDKLMDAKTVIKLKLIAKKEGMVYSGELTGKIKVVHDQIPITSLKKGQELEIIATAKVGKGSKHSKFSPGLMFYKNVVDIQIDKNCPQEVINICPQKILKTENGKIIVEDNYKCDMCEACVELCKKQGKDSIKLIPTKELTITLESFGQLTIEEIFKKSIEALKKDLTIVAKKINK
jgi:DNA-directed RNA polymerase subunit D